MWMGGQRHAPAALSPGKDPVPIVQEAVWASGPVWTGAENLPPPPTGFQSRTVQPVASRSTDWAIAAHPPYRTGIKCVWIHVFVGLYDVTRRRRSRLLRISRCASYCVVAARGFIPWTAPRELRTSYGPHFHLHCISWDKTCPLS